jgi:hypothetical protein
MRPPEARSPVNLTSSLSREIWDGSSKTRDQMKVNWKRISVDGEAARRLGRVSAPAIDPTLP